MARTYSPTGSQPPSVELTMRQGPRPGQRFSVTRPAITVGREAGNDVVINDPQISRRHATLTWDGRRFIIQDLGSANGTFVNGVRLTTPQVLQQGDVIGLGSTVLLGFQVMLPVVSPAAPPAYVPPPPARAPRPAARWRGRFLIPLTASLGLCLVLAMAAAAGYFFLRPRDEARPLVLIRSPRYGEQVEVGQAVTVHSVARDEGKVTRVELWVDGQLQQTQTSPLPGGTSPFPLLARWQPLWPGTHTLIARAFNAQGRRSQASINVEAIEGADRDGDGVADGLDACPDEPGTETADGCPDRDADTIPDAEDACPDEPGLIEYDGCPMTDDRDGDGISDDDDECPDESGTPVTEGCPDTDGDSIPDYGDACPEEPGAPGAPAGDGCPAPSDTDRDGDGIPDDKDECPDEGGSPVTEGCPDADGDGVRDGEDACPEEPGLTGDDGCPVRGGGEDGDGDGVRDEDDECPDEPGLPGHDGCPDRDGDGVPDPDDLRPDEPGRTDAGGAPDTGAEDSDGDGIADDMDPCPEEWGTLENGGCPPPWDGADADGDGTPDDEEPPEGSWSGLRPFWPPPGGGGSGDSGGEKAAVPVEVEVLWFEMSGTSDWYQEVYCYVGLGDWEVDRHSLSRVGQWRWDGVLEGENSRIILADDEESLDVMVECWASEIRSEPPWDLGSHVQQHPPADWHGQVFEASSSGGAEGHSFRIEYRMCTPTCDTGGLPPPTLALVNSNFIGRALFWNWEGLAQGVRFKLYIDGNFTGNTFDPNVRNWVLPDRFNEISCSDRVEFQLAAYTGDRFAPDQESPRSDTVVLEGSPCPRTVRVTFEQLETFDLRDERRMDGDLGPVFGSFGAYGSTGDSLYFRGSDYPDGWVFSPYSVYSIQTMLETIQWWQDACMGGGCEWRWYRSPGVNHVTVELGPGDDLTIGGAIYDQDRRMYQEVFNGWHTIRVGEPIPGTYTIRDQQIELTYSIDVLVGPEVGPRPDLTISDVTASEGGLLRIHVFNNAADLINQDVTVELVRMSTEERIDLHTWPNVNIPSGGEIILQDATLVLEPSDLRVILDPNEDIGEMYYDNNTYETPVMLRVEFVQLALPFGEGSCEGWLDREGEHWFLFWVGYGPSEDEIRWAGHRVRYPESDFAEFRMPPAGGTRSPPWNLEGQERYTFGFEMPADENLYIMISGYEHDPSREQPMGTISVAYGPDMNYGHSDEMHSAQSSGPGTEDCEEWEIIGHDYFGFEAEWRITRVR